mmetsp:Transcript_31759/g.48723  ORF Transcript_31759/g.48723 Transcript_31759/m.48723 type:complete len:84 (-) Transcript_31759:741-992(-)
MAVANLSKVKGSPQTAKLPLQESKKKLIKPSARLSGLHTPRSEGRASPDKVEQLKKSSRNLIVVVDEDQVNKKGTVNSDDGQF